MHDHECDVAVIGGGLAGATAALGFAQQSCSVRLFERRDLARDPNRGDILHAPTVEIVRRLGLLDHLEERGAGRWHGLEIVDFDGKIDVRSEIRESWLLNHSEMEAAFLDASEAAGVVVQPDVVRNLSREEVSAGDGWLIQTDDGNTRARLVVGADGAESFTRRTLGIELAEAQDYDNCIVVLHSPSPSWLRPDHGWTLLHPAGSVFLLPTTPVGRHRVIISISREDIKEWMTSSETELTSRLEQRWAPLRELQLNKRGGSHVYRIKRTHAASYWGPRAALAGDAAHTISPMGGQGLNIAIQDSVKLADLVGPVLNNSDRSEGILNQALADYQATRWPINTATIELAHFFNELAGPGEASYERALEYYSRAASDPNFVREFHSQFGGGE